MAELSPDFGLVQYRAGRSAAAGREPCTGFSLEIPHCSTLSFPFPGSQWLFEPPRSGQCVNGQ